MEYCQECKYRRNLNKVAALLVAYFEQLPADLKIELERELRANNIKEVGDGKLPRV